MIFSGEIKNLEELEKLGKLLIPLLQPNIYLILQGKLGVGKTTLAQLIAKSLGIKEKITSPTFTIYQRYLIKDNYHFNHFDFFRLNTSDNLNFFQELTIDSLNIIEWPEKNPQFWQDKKCIHLELVKQSSGIRIITLNIPFSVNKSQKIKLFEFFSLT